MKVENFCVIFSIGSLFIMMVWIFADVFMRTLFNSPIPGTTEITGEYFMVIIIFLSLSYALRKKDHIQVLVLFEKLSDKSQSVLKILTNILILVVLIISAYTMFNTSIDSLERNIRSSSVLGYPISPALFLIAIGITFLCCRLIVESIEEIKFLISDKN